MSIEFYAGYKFLPTVGIKRVKSGNKTHNGLGTLF